MSLEIQTAPSGQPEIDQAMRAHVEKGGFEDQVGPSPVQSGQSDAVGGVDPGVVAEVEKRI